MKLKELVAVLGGRENVEIHIDGQRFHFTTANAKQEWTEREIKSVSIDPNIYLGIIIHIADVEDTIIAKLTHEITCKRCGEKHTHYGLDVMCKKCQEETGKIYYSEVLRCARYGRLEEC